MLKKTNESGLNPVIHSYNKDGARSKGSRAINLRKISTLIAAAGVTGLLVAYQSCGPVNVIGGSLTGNLASSAVGDNLPPSLEENIPLDDVNVPGTAAYCALYRFTPPSILGVSQVTDPIVDRTRLFQSGFLMEYGTAVGNGYGGTVNIGDGNTRSSAPDRLGIRYQEGRSSGGEALLSQTVNFDCDSSDDRLNVNCNQDGIRISANDNNNECQPAGPRRSGDIEATISVTVVDGCFNQNNDNESQAINEFSFSVKYRNNCLNQQAVQPALQDRQSQFGKDVDIDGNRAVVAHARASNSKGPNAGSAIVYALNNSQWIEEAILIPNISSPALPGSDEVSSVALSGNRIVIGSQSYGPNGAIFIFERGNSGWTEQIRIDAPATTSITGMRFGAQVDISGGTIAVSAHVESLGGSLVRTGAVYVYTGSGSSWTQAPRITANIADQQVEALFGYSLSLEANTLAVGAPITRSVAISNGGSNNSMSGRAFLFKRSSNVWNQTHVVSPPSGQLENGAQFGAAVATDNSRVIVGAPFMNATRGAAFEFSVGASNGSVAALAINQPSSLNSDDRFGSAVAVAGNHVIVSSPKFDQHRGRAFYYSGNLGSLSEKWILRPRNAFHSSEDQFGEAIAISNGISLIGNRLFDGGNNDTGAAMFITLP